MAFVIDGTTGIATVDGSVSAPSQRGQDTNTGISYAADTIKFSTNGVERMSITNSGVVGAGGGKVLQVKQTFINTAVSINGVTSYADITGFNVSITPSSASNKILVMVQMNASSAGEYIMKLVRTAGGSSSDIGNSTAGYYTSFTGGFHNTARSGYYDFQDKNFNFLDDAQDTNAHIYKVQWSNITSVFTCINRTAYHTSTVNYSYSGSSTITAMEIAA